MRSHGRFGRWWAAGALALAAVAGGAAGAETRNDVGPGALGEDAALGAIGAEAAGLVVAGLAGAGPLHGAVGAAEAAAAKRRHLASRATAATKTDGKTVTVDCAKGQSLQAAIDQGASVVEVRGICHENLRVERRPITLRGNDPALDGVRGVAAEPQPAAAIEIYYSEQTVIENLSIAEGAGAGVGMWYSHVVIRDSVVGPNPALGIHVSASSFLTAERLDVSNNGTTGLNVQRGSQAFCADSVFAGNGLFAASSTSGGVLSLLSTTVTGLRGIRALFGAYADIDCVSAPSTHPCSLSVTERAAQANQQATVALFGAGDFSGWVAANDRSHALFLGARQVDTGTPPNANRALGFSTLITEPIDDGVTVHESRLRGQTFVRGFSRALLNGATEIDGTLTCQSAGDAWADPAVVLTPGSAIVDCEHAPPPGP